MGSQSKSNGLKHLKEFFCCHLKIFLFPFEVLLPFEVLQTSNRLDGNPHHFEGSTYLLMSPLGPGMFNKSLILDLPF